MGNTVAPSIEEFDPEEFVEVQRLNHGACGDVHLVENKKSKERIVERRVYLTDDKEVTLAEDEERAVEKLRPLNHANVVRFFGVFKHDGDYSFFLEYCECGSFEKKIDERRSASRPFQETEILTDLIQIARGLAFIHSNGILHRDLQPQNLLLTKDGCLKMYNFGTSTKIAAQKEKFSTGVAVPDYMAPEVLTEETYDHRCDIWSLGVIVYELATLRLPFTGENTHALMLKVATGVFDALPETQSKWLRDLVAETIQRDPKRRPDAETILNKEVCKIGAEAMQVHLDVKEQLEQQLVAERDTNDRAKRDISAYEEHARALSEKICSLGRGADEVRLLQAKLADLEQKVGAARNKTLDAENQVAVYQDQVRELNEKIEAMKREAARRDEEMVQQQVDLGKKLILQQEVEFEELQSKVNAEKLAAQAEVQAVREQMRKLLEENDRLRMELRTEEDQQGIQLSADSDDMRSCFVDLTAFPADKSDAEKIRAEWEERLRREIERLGRENEEKLQLTEEINASLRDELKRLLSSRDAEKIEAQNEVLQVQEQMRKLAEENGDLKMQLQAKESMQSSPRCTDDELTSAFDEAVTYFGDTKETAKTNVEWEQRLRSETERLERENEEKLKKLQETALSQEVELEQLRASRDAEKLEAQMEVLQVQEQMRRLAEENDQLKMQLRTNESLPSSPHSSMHSSMHSSLGSNVSDELSSNVSDLVITSVMDRQIERVNKEWEERLQSETQRLNRENEEKLQRIKETNTSLQVELEQLKTNMDAKKTETENEVQEMRESVRSLKEENDRLKMERNTKESQPSSSKPTDELPTTHTVDKSAIEQNNKEWEERLRSEIERLERENEEKLKMAASASRQKSFNEAVRRAVHEKETTIDDLTQRERTLRGVIERDRKVFEKLQGVLQAERSTPSGQVCVDVEERLKELHLGDLSSAAQPVTSESREDEAEFSLKLHGLCLPDKFKSLVQSNNVTISSCNDGDVVLLCYHDKYRQYIVFTTLNTIHFLNTECLQVLGLSSDRDVAKNSWAVGKITSKDYCKASKESNRFRVPVGTKFYRVVAAPRYPKQ